MQEFMKAYVGAICFTEEISKIEKDQEDQIKKDCKIFFEQNEKLIKSSYRGIDADPISKAGHDFWMTRQGHGTGFWDDFEWEASAGKTLTENAKKFGEFLI